MSSPPLDQTRPPSIHATPHLTLGHSDHSRHKDTKTTLYNFSVMRVIWYKYTNVQGSHKKFTEIGVIASLCLRPPAPTLAGRPALSPRPDLPSPGPTRRVPRMTAPVCQGGAGVQGEPRCVQGHCSGGMGIHTKVHLGWRLYRRLRYGHRNTTRALIPPAVR